LNVRPRSLGDIVADPRNGTQRNGTQQRTA
jgi:hypothetical protein